jgi:hypothetical protein
MSLISVRKGNPTAAYSPVSVTSAPKALVEVQWAPTPLQSEPNIQENNIIDT